MEYYKRKRSPLIFIIIKFTVTVCNFVNWNKCTADIDLRLVYFCKVIFLSMKLLSHFFIHSYYGGKLYDFTFFCHKEFLCVPYHVFDLFLATPGNSHASYLLKHAVVSLHDGLINWIFLEVIIPSPYHAFAFTNYHAGLTLLALVEHQLNLLLEVIENAKKNGFASLTELHSDVARLFILITVSLLQKDSLLIFVDLRFANYSLSILQVAIIVFLLVNNVAICEKSHCFTSSEFK